VSVSSQFRKEREAIALRQHDIEDDHVVVMSLGEPKSLFAIAGEIDRVAGIAQRGAQRALQARGVFDYENTHGSGFGMDAQSMIGS